MIRRMEGLMKKFTLLLIGVVLFGGELAARAVDTTLPTADYPPGMSGYVPVAGQNPHGYFSIWIYGNSALGVPVSGETIPDYLQAALPTARVVNVGWPGASAGYEYELLTETPIRPGDVVLFYDGAVDIGYLKTAAQDDSLFRYPCGRYAQALHNAKLELLARLCAWVPPVDLRTVDPVWKDAHETALVAAYRRSLDYAAQYARRRGVTFVHVLQPGRCASHLTEDELSWSETCAFTQSVEATLRDTETGWDFMSVLTDVPGARFEPQSSSHVNATGNAYIASRLAEVLAPWF